MFSRGFWVVFVGILLNDVWYMMMCSYDYVGWCFSDLKFYIISIIMKVCCMIIMLIGSLRSLMFVLFLSVSMGNRL